MVKLHRVRVHFEQGVTTPSSWLRNTNCTNKRRRHQPCRRVAKSVILPLYTVSHKKIPTFSAATQVAYALSDFNNFWQECFKEADRWKIILFPTSSDWLVFLHYLAKLETRKLHLFTDEMKLLYVAWLFLWDSVHAPCCNAVNNADVGITHKQIRHLRDSQLQCIASVTKHYKTRMLINQSAIHFIRVKEKKRNILSRRNAKIRWLHCYVAHVEEFHHFIKARKLTRSIFYSKVQSTD